MSLLATPAVASDTVLLHAAGSLRGALTEVAQGFEKSSGFKVQAKFGASGLLRDEIAGGARAELFASANMEHPQALAKALAEGRADIFLAYCTAARDTQKENADLQMIALPDELAVGADYGLTVMADASPGAYQFALFILSPEGQRILAAYGFSAPNLP